MYPKVSEVRSIFLAGLPRISSHATELATILGSAVSRSPTNRPIARTSKIPFYGRHLGVPPYICSSTPVELQYYCSTILPVGQKAICQGRPQVLKRCVMADLSANELQTYQGLWILQYGCHSAISDVTCNGEPFVIYYNLQDVRALCPTQPFVKVLY